MLQDNINLCIYSFLWIIYYLIYRKHNKTFNGGSALILLYGVLSLVSIAYYNNEFYSKKLGIELFPFLYLFITVMITMLPITKFCSDKKITHIQKPSANYIYIVSWVIILVSIIVTPSIISDMRSGIFSILTNADAGLDLYQDGLENYVNGESAIVAIFSLLSSFSILLLLCLPIFKVKNKIIIYGLLYSFIINLLHPISQGSRTKATLLIITTIITFFCLKQFYSKKAIRIINRLMIAVCSMIAVPFVALTVSRYGEKDGGGWFSFLRYAGESSINFNQYCLYEPTSRNADKVFPLFKRLLGYNNIPENYVELRAKYSNMAIDDSVFYTFMGDFVLDFNPYFAIVFVMLLSMIFISLTSRKNNSNTILFHQIIMLYIAICLCANGSLYLYTYGYKAGNYKLITLILIYLFTKFSYYASKSKSHSLLSPPIPPNSRK